MSAVGCRAGLGVASLLLLAGCVMPDHVAQLRKELADVQQELRRVQQEQAEGLARVDQVEADAQRVEPGAPRTEVADLGVRVDQAARDASIAVERTADLERRIDDVSQELQQVHELVRRGAGAGAAGPPDGLPAEEPLPGTEPDPAARRPAGSGALPDPRTLYNTAYADFSKGNYDLAIAGFEEYQQLFPRSPDADNAQYWVGESYYSQGKFSEAIRAFDQLLEGYSKSDKAAAADLKKALVFEEQNQVGQAIVQLRYVVSAYPGSDESRIAKDKLNSLGAPP